MFSFLGCGVRGEPSRRQDEIFIRKSQVVKSIEEQSGEQTKKVEEKDKEQKQKLIKVKEKR